MELDKAALDRHITGNYGEDFFDNDSFPRCFVCGEDIDYCQGHGEIGDPAGFAILQAHDAGDHSRCDVHGCDEAYLNSDGVL